jgi:hypothetical protein
MVVEAEQKTKNTKNLVTTFNPKIENFLLPSGMDCCDVGEKFFFLKHPFSYRLHR